MKNPTQAPTASSLFNPLVKVLGTLINFDESVCVSRDDVYDAVLLEAGIDPTTTTLPLKGRTGLYRLVQFAHRNQRDGYCGTKRAATTTLTTAGGWSLTAAGVALSQALNGTTPPVVVAVATSTPQPSSPNETSEWLAGQPPAFWNRLESAIASKCRVSAKMDLVGDHINNAVERWVKRNAFADRIHEGNPPSYSDCATWAIRSAFTDIRGWGKWGDAKALRGAMTEKERKEKEEHDKKRTQFADEGTPAQFGGGQVSFDLEGALLEVEDVSHGNDIETTLHMEWNIGWAEETIRARMPIAHERYTKVLHWLIEGYKAREIADFEGVSVYRASTMVADLKALLRKAREDEGW